jgi:quercetin dioxygenase-like cupin family protein
MDSSKLRVASWAEDGPPTEDRIRQLLGTEGLQAYRWSNGPGDTYNAHLHAYHKVIYVVSGSITFGLPESAGKVNLEPGDRLDLPAGTKHNATVGPRGVVCLEAHR